MAEIGRQGRPLPGKQRQRQQLSRETIIAAALEIVEEQGLKKLTMRALGDRLGVEAMALYHYFPSKDALLEAVSEIGGTVEAQFGAFFDDMSARGATPGEMSSPSACATSTSPSSTPASSSCSSTPSPSSSTPGRSS